MEAKSNAQKIAFGPIVFQATLALRNLGILDLLLKNHKKGLQADAIATKLNLPLYGVKVLLEAGLGAQRFRRHATRRQHDLVRGQAQAEKIDHLGQGRFGRHVHADHAT